MVDSPMIPDSLSVEAEGASKTWASRLQSLHQPVDRGISGETGVALYFKENNDQE